MALIVTPEAPLKTWFTALDEQLVRCAEFFADRPIVADLATVLETDQKPETLLEALDGLVTRNLRVIGAEGVHSTLLAGTRWEQLPTVLHGRDAKRDDKTETESAAPVTTPATTTPATGAPSLLIDQPVRSGQSIYFEEGDVTVVGSVASGSEVIAGGSVHIYGALRGRAIAGVKAGPSARIFCRKLEAELIAVDGLYRTAEHWGPSLHGCAAQIQCDRGALRILALD